MSFTLSIKGTPFQIRLNRVQNCLQWTSSDIITSRVDDIESLIALSIEEHCHCGFTVYQITDGGFQCFPGSETHVTFRARLTETTQRSTEELVMYLETSVANARSWLIQGQHLTINHTCILVIADIHSPECPQNDMHITPTITCSTMAECDIVQNSDITYFIWALASTSLLLLLLIISCTLISAIVILRRKLSTLSRYIKYFM